MSNNELVRTNNYPVEAQEQENEFGRYVKKSIRLCDVCRHTQHMDINLLRARDHWSLPDISQDKGIHIDTLKLHFRKHFQISTKHQKILDVMENDSRESNELVSKIFEGELDLFTGAQTVLESKAQRLHIIKERLKELAELQEVDGLDDVGKQEFVLLNREAGNIENDILKVWQIIDKKLFPASKEDLSNAILSFKLNILKKFVDSIILIFLEYEKNPEYADLVRNIRVALVPVVSNLESTILKSGGVIELEKKDDERIITPL